MNYIEKALNVLNKIDKEGYQAYIVGGAVRDYLLNIDFDDIDICTNMPSSELAKLFTLKKNNGHEYLSFTCMIDKYKFEITHFRKDISYKDHRHPVVAEVESLDEDLARRDFTINALALDNRMTIIDEFGGRSDLRHKVIKMIGNPDVRFDEDALRMLRALYFSSKLGFTIEDETLNSIIRNKKLLECLSFERIFDHFKRILYGKYDNGINYIIEYDLFEYIPKFKKLLACVDKTCLKKDLEVYYYLKYNELFSNNNKVKKDASTLKLLLNCSYDKYVIFNNIDLIHEYKNLLTKLGYYNEFKKIISGFKIKKDSELLVSKKEISDMFDGKKISLAIEYVTRLVLDNKIENSREDILRSLEEF